jgi:anti-sigma B factor antagonist
MTPLPRFRNLEVAQTGDVTVVKFTEREYLDDEQIQILGQQLGNLVEHFGRRHMVLNLAAVERVSTALISRLVVLHKKVKAAGGRMALCHVQPNLREVLEVLRLPLLFPIYAAEEEALRTF